MSYYKEICWQRKTVETLNTPRDQKNVIKEIYKIYNFSLDTLSRQLVAFNYSVDVTFNYSTKIISICIVSVFNEILGI